MKSKTAPRKSSRTHPTGTQQWVELFPYGLSLTSMKSRPILVLKDRTLSEALPIWLSHMDAGLAMTDLSQNPQGPHAVSMKVLSTLGIQLVRCEINEIVGHHQYLKLYFSGNSTLSELRVRADEALSFCLAMKARFFSTQEFIARCRDLDAEFAHSEMALLKEAKSGSKNSLYVM